MKKMTKNFGRLNGAIQVFSTHTMLFFHVVLIFLFPNYKQTNSTQTTEFFVLLSPAQLSLHPSTLHLFTSQQTDLKEEDSWNHFHCNSTFKLTLWLETAISSQIQPLTTFHLQQHENQLTGTFLAVACNIGNWWTYSEQNHLWSSKWLIGRKHKQEQLEQELTTCSAILPTCPLCLHQWFISPHTVITLDWPATSSWKHQLKEDLDFGN